MGSRPGHVDPAKHEQEEPMKSEVGVYEHMGLPYNKDPKKVPRISEAPKSGDHDWLKSMPM